jgi:hypothetical protein
MAPSHDQTRRLFHRTEEQRIQGATRHRCQAGHQRYRRTTNPIPLHSSQEHKRTHRQHRRRRPHHRARNPHQRKHHTDHRNKGPSPTTTRQTRQHQQHRQNGPPKTHRLRSNSRRHQITLLNPTSPPTSPANTPGYSPCCLLRRFRLFALAIRLCLAFA